MVKVGTIVKVAVGIGVNEDVGVTVSVGAGEAVNVGDGVSGNRFSAHLCPMGLVKIVAIIGTIIVIRATMI